MATRHSNIFNINIKNDHIADYFFFKFEFLRIALVFTLVLLTLFI